MTTESDARENETEGRIARFCRLCREVRNDAGLILQWPRGRFVGLWIRKSGGLYGLVAFVAYRYAVYPSLEHWFPEIHEERIRKARKKKSKSRADDAGTVS